MATVYSWLAVFLFPTLALSLPANIFNIYSSTGQACNPDPVAFSVGRTTGLSPPKMSHIQMDHVYYNKQRHFDMTTSEFTAPVDGVYEFSFGATSAYGKPIYLLLFVQSEGNGRIVTGTFNYNAGAQSYKQASTVVYVELKKGDRASLRLDGKKGIYGQKGTVTTQFSGHLLK